MTEIKSFERKTLLFVGRPVKGMTEGELARVDEREVNKADIGNDLYLGFFVGRPYPGQTQEDAIRKLADEFREVCEGVEPQLYSIVVTKSVVEGQV